MTDLNEESIIYWRGSSLYLNITNKCSNNCVFCVRNYRVGVFGFKLQLKKDPQEEKIIQEINKALSNQYTEVVFTGYGEPLERLDVVCNIAKEIRKLAPDILIRLDTNGLGELINPDADVITNLKEAGINLISISLNASNKETYDKLCKPRFGIKSFEAILKFAEKAKENFEVNFTIVDVPQVDVETCQQLAEEYNIPLKIRHYSGPKLVFD